MILDVVSSRGWQATAGGAMIGPRQASGLASRHCPTWRFHVEPTMDLPRVRRSGATAEYRWRGSVPAGEEAQLASAPGGACRPRSGVGPRGVHGKPAKSATIGPAHQPRAGATPGRIPVGHDGASGWTRVAACCVRLPGIGRLRWSPGSVHLPRRSLVLAAPKATPAGPALGAQGGHGPKAVPAPHRGCWGSLRHRNRGIVGPRR